MLVVAFAFPLVVVAQDGPHTVIGHDYAEGLGRIWVQRGIEAAVSRLHQPRCHQLFAEFSDRKGVPVVRTLEDLKVTPEEYLTHWIRFVEGSRQPVCRNGDIAAFTRPGSRVIYICSARVAAFDAPRGDIVIIHEMLHSLGLGENPPTSKQITARVLQRCTP